MDNVEVIRSLYAALGRRDADAMMRCYHPDIVFADPVFGELSLSQVKAMWEMLCTRGEDLKIELISAEADAQRGSAEWEATYTFQKTKRFVRNRVRSRFAFRDGLIVEQRDEFNFWKWARMALGTSGQLLGWTPLLKNAVRKEVTKSLQTFALERAR